MLYITVHTHTCAHIHWIHIFILYMYKQCTRAHTYLHSYTYMYMFYTCTQLHSPTVSNGGPARHTCKPHEMQMCKWIHPWFLYQSDLSCLHATGSCGGSVIILRGPFTFSPLRPGNPLSLSMCPMKKDC